MVSKELSEYLKKVEPRINRENLAYLKSDYVDTNKKLSRLGEPLPENIINEIKKILKEKNHPSSDKIIETMVVLYTLLPSDFRDQKILSNFFEIISQKIYLKQYMFFGFGFEGDLENIELKVGNYTFGKRFKVFKDFVEAHSSSDYATRFKKMHEDEIGVERKNFAIVAFDFFKWKEIIESCKKGIFDTELNKEIIDESINDYLQEILLPLRNKFITDFEQQQYFINSMLGFKIDINTFSRFKTPTYVNVVYNFNQNERNGWVVGLVHYLREFKISKNNIKIANKIKDLPISISNPQNEFCRKLEIALSFFSNAQDFINHKKFSDAFINYWIGLEFLLASETVDDNQNQQNQTFAIKHRLAVLTFEYFKDANYRFYNHKGFIIELYRRRNLYVHRGELVSDKDLNDMRNLSRILVGILYRKIEKHNSLNYADWLKKIDSKNKELTGKEKYELGIDDHDKKYIDGELYGFWFEDAE